MTGSSSGGREATRIADSARTPCGAARAGADARSGCTSFHYPLNPDRRLAIRRARSSGSALRSFHGLRIRKTAPVRSEKPAAAFPHVRGQAFRSLDAVRCYNVCDIRGSLFIGRSILPAPVLIFGFGSCPCGAGALAAALAFGLELVPVILGCLRLLNGRLLCIGSCFWGGAAIRPR